MTERVTITDLAFDAQPIPPGVDVSTAVIATAEPKELKRVIKDVFVANAIATIRSSDEKPQAKEAELEELLNKPSSFSQRRAARRILENTLASQQYAQVELFVIEPELKLADEVDRQVLALSKPARWAATALSALALGGTFGGIIYETAHESNQRAHASAIQFNQNQKSEYHIDVPPVELEGGQKAIVLGAGGSMAVMGGALGSLLGIGISGRVARRRAAYQFKKAASSAR
jgi:hypothetical protein